MRQTAKRWVGPVWVVLAGSCAAMAFPARAVAFDPPPAFWTAFVPHAAMPATCDPAGASIGHTPHAFPGGSVTGGPADGARALLEPTTVTTGPLTGGPPTDIASGSVVSAQIGAAHFSSSAGTADVTFTLTSGAATCTMFEHADLRSLGGLYTTSYLDRLTSYGCDVADVSGGGDVGFDLRGTYAAVVMAPGDVPYVERGRFVFGAHEQGVSCPSGGSGNASSSFFFQPETREALDAGAPTVVGVPDRSPDANGWYRGPVLVDWQASDPAPSSGAPTDPPSTLVSSEGADLLVTSAPSCDPVGNCTSGSVRLSIDATPPQVSISGVAEGAVYETGAALPSPGCTATDAGGSGLSGACTVSVRADVAGSAVGGFTVTAQAGDVAGNVTTTTQHYSVRYRWTGFLQPIVDTAHASQLNSFRAGASIPVKFRLDPVAGQPASAPRFTASGPGGALATGTFAFSTDQWLFVWHTNGRPAGVWTITALLDDGTRHEVAVTLR